METRTIKFDPPFTEAVAKADEHTRNAVYEALIEWVEKTGGIAGEVIMQDDECQLTAAVLLSEIVDDILEIKTYDIE